MFTIRTLVIPVGALLSGASAHAAAEAASPARAVIASITGSALVSTQSEIVPALAGMELEPLNRLFVLEDGRALVTFTDGCEKELAENEMLTISERGGCEAAHIERSATSVAQSLTPQSSFAIAVGAPSSAAAPLLFGAGGAGLLGLTAAEAAAIAFGTIAAGAVIANNTGDDDNPGVPQQLSP